MKGYAGRTSPLPCCFPQSGPRDARFNPGNKNAPGTSALANLPISPEIRDSLSWGSLLMGIAFAHAD